jgi:hypothetical protein
MQLSLNFALSGLPPVSDIAYFHRLELKAGTVLKPWCKMTGKSREPLFLCHKFTPHPDAIKKRVLDYVFPRKYTYFAIVRKV